MPAEFAIIIPAYNAAATLGACLGALTPARARGAQCIVVDDGSTDATRGIAEAAGVLTLSTGGRRGPAVARNLGARAAEAEILWFVDADVCAHDDALDRLAAHFRAAPDLAAVIGAYDDAPSERDFLSQYRNLMHSFYHRASGADVRSFWAGCGAIRRDVFLAQGGFSEAYARPSIEDIELGYRLSQAGHRIRLDPAVEGTHLKRWSFRKMVATDVRDRAMPWTELILRHGSMPDHLNLQRGQRLSVALTGLAVALAVVATALHGATVLVPIAAAAMVLLARHWIDPGAAGAPAKLCLGAALTAALAAASWAGGAARLAESILVILGFLLAGLLPAARTGIAASAYALGQLGALAASLAFLPRDAVTAAFLLAVVAIAAINSRFYRFIAARRGWSFALAVVPFHLLYFFYSGAAFALVTARHLWARHAAS